MSCLVDSEKVANSLGQNSFFLIFLPVNTFELQHCNSRLFTERTNTVFNSQSWIQIGGLVDQDTLAKVKKGLNITPQISKPFRGQMAGFFFNDDRVFKSAVKGKQTIRSLHLVNLS